MQATNLFALSLMSFMVHTIWQGQPEKTLSALHAGLNCTYTIKGAPVGVPQKSSLFHNKLSSTGSTEEQSVPYLGWMLPTHSQ